MKKVFLFLLAAAAGQSQTLNEAQLDSLYNLFVRTHNIAEEMLPDHLYEPLEPHHVKCGFGLINQIKLNIDQFSTDKKSLLMSYLARPINMQTSLVSASARFRIHFDTTGSKIPRYNPSWTPRQNAEEVGRALDSAYNFEVNFLGYLPPPQDNGQGGDPLYDLYIIDYAGALYGETETEDPLGNNKYTSFIRVDNDYLDKDNLGRPLYASEGLNGMRVTVAHELHHAIQIGNYIFRGNDLFFYELSSTAMEEFVFDTVNDYYAYMRDYFDNPDRAFANNNGYNLAAWNIFLRDKFGYGILKRQWEMMPSVRALAAIHNSLVEVNSSFREAYNEFGLWTFFTKHRAKPGEYFEEAANYPLIKLTPVTFNPASTPVTMDVKATSNNFIAFINSTVSPTDTLAALITNGDYAAAINDFATNFPFEYILAGDLIAGSTKLTDRYFVKINVDNPGLWSVSEILNNHVLRQGGNITPPVESDEVFAYPNPFYYNKTYNSVFIILGDGTEPEYDFNLYTSGMELVYSTTLTASNKTLRWDIKNSVKEKLASGVYIFAARSGNKTHKGKLVIFNE
jgi:hypothetical protein